ncbi:glutamate receptor 2-like isoform X1 [Acropora millepora]|uniref:glutamate receptor 2-like isoform X1 n=1 Tax=Acropora millepora TaxID=45264 RepID=UPI001CF252E8|nr:glutamate receptor 2-like isoform X1 [Acropora millepora]
MSVTSQRADLRAFTLVVFSLSAVAAIPIKIGVLYSSETKGLLKILEKELAQHRLKNHRLELIRQSVDADLLSREVASDLSHAFSIIDLATKKETALALSSLLQVPLIKLDSLDEDTPYKYVISMKPSYRAICRALKDIKDFYSFQQIAVVYDARKSRLASTFFAEANKWPTYKAQMMPELLLHEKEKLRESLTTLLKSHIKQVILFCDHKDLVTIMNEALFVGINDKELKWIVSDLEIAGLNKTDPSILGLVGLSLHVADKTAAKKTKKAVSEGAREFSLAMYATVQDAAIVIAKATETFLTSKDGERILRSYQVSGGCPLRSMKEGETALGQRMLNEMKMVQFKGLTGQVEFDRGTGERLLVDGMDIMNVVHNGVVQVGSWKPKPGVNDNFVSTKSSKEPHWLGDFAEFVKCHNPGPPGSGPARSLPKVSITTVLEPPFVEIKNKSLKREDVAGKVVDGDLQGFLIDLIRALAKEAKFEYDLYLRSDSGYQKMIDELTRQERDMALAPITITAEREESIDFSKPFMDFSLSLIMQKPGEPPINKFAFLQPFTGGVWLSTIGVVLFITVMMCVMDFLTPFGYRARARQSDDEPGNEFNLLNSLWFATASVLQQGPDSTPLAPSGRLLASTFWFFILILISTYTANLAAFFTIKRTADTINSLEALANQNDIKYGVMKGGSVMKFFETSDDSLYRKMFSHMREYKTFVEGTKAGVDKARTEKYAYITEYPYLEYYNQQKPCNTKLLKNLIQTKSYGIGLQRNSPFTNRITVAILKLREKNFIEKTRRSWWDDRSQCPKPSQSKTGNTQSLDVNNLAGVFIILLGGVIVSVVLLIIERRCKKLVDLLTNSQRAIKRRLSRESREPRDHNNTFVRVGVVLSQGERVLKPIIQQPTETSRWKNWFGRD